MKITSRTLSIPPYLSTSWKNISSLYIQEKSTPLLLVVTLQNGRQIEIPGLNQENIEEIFEAHARSSETELSFNRSLISPLNFDAAIKSDGTPEIFTTSMQHNPEQANFPLIPADILKKITVIARAFGLEETSPFSKPEPHCNCVYCQITRAFQAEENLIDKSEEVDPEDLKFRDWDIQQTAGQLYNVTNPLDQNEQYSVFLGTPLGCTCGAKNCEHIRAVLKS